MSDEIEVGSKVVHVERMQGLGTPREILRTKIACETPTQWVDLSGGRWNKKTLAQVPQYKPGPRFIMTPEAFAKVAK